jgi:ferritin-like protein
VGGRGSQPSRRHGNLPAQRRTSRGRRPRARKARRLADRIGDLGGAVTADPRQLVDRAPGDTEFVIPDCSDPRAITRYALHRLDVIITAYQAFLDTVRGRDDVSFALVVGLLATEAHRRADVMAALAGQGAAV